MVNPLNRSLKEIAGQGYPVGQDELGRTIFRGPIGDYTETQDAPQAQGPIKKVSGLDIIGQGLSDAKEWLQDEDESVLGTLSEMAKGAIRNTWDSISSATDPDATLGDAFGAAGTAMGAGSMGTAPKDALRVFAGRNSKTSNRGFDSYDEDNPFNKAFEMREAGEHPEDIWRETGWEFDEKNRAWQYEIDPNDLQLDFDKTVLSAEGVNDADVMKKWGSREKAFKEFTEALQYGLKDAPTVEIDATELIKHPKLFEAYPSLERTALRFYEGEGGSFHVEKGPNNTLNPIIEIGTSSLRNERELLKVITHELQHGVQAAEGWDGGANWEAMPRLYKKEIKEIAARNSLLQKRGAERQDILETRLATLLGDANDLDLSDDDLDSIRKETEKIYDEMDKIAELDSLLTDKDDIALAMYYANTGEIEARAAEQRIDSPDNSDIPPSYTKNKALQREHEPFQGKVMRTAPLTVTSRPREYAEGGMTMDPTQVTPPGGISSDTKDVVPAKLAEGEYVIPANVVRYLGLDKIRKLVIKAEEEMSQMENGGEVGGAPAPQASPEAPTDARAFAEGGVVAKPSFNPANYQTVGQTLYGQAQAAAPAPANETKIINYVNSQGNIMPVTFVNGQPTTNIPPGFRPQGTPAPAPQQANPQTDDHSELDQPETDENGQPRGAFGGRNPFELSREELTASVDDIKNGLEMLGKAGQVGGALASLNPMLGGALAIGMQVAKGSAVSNLNRAALVAEARGDTALAGTIRESVSGFTEGKLNIGGVPTGEKRFQRDRESYIAGGGTIAPYGAEMVSSSKGTPNRSGGGSSNNTTGAPSYSISDSGRSDDRSDPISRSEPSRSSVTQQSSTKGDFAAPSKDLSFGGGKSSNSSKGVTQQSNTPGDFTAPSGGLSFGGTSTAKEDRLHFKKGGLVRRKMC